MLVLHISKNVKKITSIVFVFITVISFTSFITPSILQPMYSRIGIQFASQFSFYSPIDRIWQFTLGGLGYLLLGRYQNPIREISKKSNLVLVIAVTILLFGQIHIGLKISSVLASFVALFIIVFKSLDGIPNFLIEKLEWLGDRSYSIYLVHMPLVYIAKYSPITRIGESENRSIQTTMAVVASMLLGSISYQKIENRFRIKGKSNLNGLKTISVTLVLTLAIPLVFFATMYTGYTYHYWGLDKNLTQPVYAADLDTKCARDLSTKHLPCTYLNVGATKIALLIGDSHAGDVSQAVVDATKEENWNSIVWVHSGCRVQFQRTVKGQVSDNCINLNNQMKGWVSQNRPDVIIVSNFVTSEMSQNDLRSALVTLQSIVPNVLLIENNPIFPDKDFMNSRPLLMSPYKPPKSFNQSAMQIKDLGASHQLATWARDRGIFTMNFHSLFCKNMTCTRYSDQGWLYRDFNHLSVVGADLTVPKFRTFLRGLSSPSTG